MNKTLPRIDGDLKSRIAAARAHVYELARFGAEKWRMRIPAQADDSDLLLATALDDALEYIEEQNKGKVPISGEVNQLPRG